MTAATSFPNSAPASTAELSGWIDGALATTPIYDLHTHLYPPSFGDYMLWGIDELINYHYLISETLRLTMIPYEQYWAMSKQQQADLIWKTLFAEHAPISEACHGVLTVLHKLGLNVASGSLKEYRDWFAQQTPESFVDRTFKLANLKTVVMTNDPFDPAEAAIWMKNPSIDPRFKSVLRIDPLLVGWPKAADQLKAMGYQVSPALDPASLREIRRFLQDWIARIKPIYIAASLPDTWSYPDDSNGTKVIQQALLPLCREHNLPLALMIGVRRQVNPSLKMAGDGLGKSDVHSFMRLCSENQQNKFLITMLSLENQHELAVAARKFRNILPFGCWWFLNNPSLIEEITRMRIELLGPSFVPQHSDARILDQVIYKWDHSCAIIGKVLKDKFADLAATGWVVTRDQVNQTVGDYLSGNFERFLQWNPQG